MELKSFINGASIPPKLVYVRNKSRRKDWLVLISTDMELSEEEIIRIYGKRWDIEVFFKAYKSYLNLVKEYRGISYDAMTARLWNISTSPKLEDFTASFIQRLPKYMQEALEREETAA